MVLDWDESGGRTLSVASVATAKSMVITASDLDRLPPEQRLVLDLDSSDTYTFDYATRGLDFGRIILSGGHSQELLSEVLENYRRRTGVALANMNKGRFTLMVKGRQTTDGLCIGLSCGCICLGYRL